MEARPLVVSWNLTRLCNERCAHCYLDAGPGADRSGELSTDECLGVIAQLRTLAPGALLIFTGGEPLLRGDVYRLAEEAAGAGFTVVVGTNGLLLDAERLARLRAAGVRGAALSLDSLRPAVHDAWRGRRGAWEATVASMENLARVGFPFVVQTTVSRANRDEIGDLVDFAAARGALVHNLFFLVPAGRGRKVAPGLSAAEEEVLLADVRRWQEEGRAGRTLLAIKCAPHHQRLLWQRDPGSPFLRGFAEGGACPAGIGYLGIRPEGDVTPCPYLPLYGGNVRRQGLAEIWHGSDLFRALRRRDGLAGRCGACEFRLLCGGCRARAYGMSGDALGEDPSCTYAPAAADRPPVTLSAEIAYRDTAVSRRGAPAGPAGEAEPVPAAGESRPAPTGGPVWTEEAERLLAAIPAFVRGRVATRVERYARERGIGRITVAVMCDARGKSVLPDSFRRGKTG